MTVTLPSGQLTVILAVGLTCWPYLFSVVCLIISGEEGLICVCKVDWWPSWKRNKGHSSSTVFLLRDSKYAGKSSGILGVSEESSPMGSKESYLLLLPITLQSPALSTCKMTLDMPVLMVFYTWRLCLAVMRPMGIRGPDSLPCHQVAERIHSSAEMKLISSRFAWALYLRGSVDISRRKPNATPTFVRDQAWVWGWCVNRGTVPVNAAVLAWQQKGVDCSRPSVRVDGDTAPTSLLVRVPLHCDQSLLRDKTLRANTAGDGRKLLYWVLGSFRYFFWTVSCKFLFHSSQTASDKRRMDSFTLYCLD